MGSSQAVDTDSAIMEKSAPAIETSQAVPPTGGILPVENQSICDEDGDATAITYVRGWRRALIFTAVCIAIFLTNVEIPIVTTALVSITNDLEGFDKSSWVISAYLLGYCGVLIIFSKASDIFGRKLMLLIALLTFVIFSAACGAAQTIQELIVFRALQGVGGAGNYAICTIICIELVPVEQYAALTGYLSIVFSLSLLVGPILGGAISTSSTWRWVFLLNAPAGALAVGILVFFLPNHFPYHKQPNDRGRKFSPVFSKESLGRIDLPGSALLLAATLLFVAAFEQAGTEYPWKSAFVITLLVLSGLFWIVFMVWERRVTLAASLREPVFPWRFVQSRIWIGMLLNALFLGAPFFVSIFQLPQKFQLVNSLSPLQAGIRLMPFTFAAPIGSAVSSIVIGKAKVPPIYAVLFASVIQVVGFSLLSTLPASSELIPAQYGYEVIAGFGCGINISTLVLMTPFCVEPRDKAVALGSVTQFRIMGGVLGLAIVTTVLNGFVRSKLHLYLSQEQIASLLRSAANVNSFAAQDQLLIRDVFAAGYNLQMKIMAGFAAAQIPSSLIMWQKPQIKV